MNGKSDFLANKELNNYFNGAPVYQFPPTIYIALFTSAPTSAGGGTEVAAGGYARLAITCNAANFPVSVAREIDNAVAFAFAQAAQAWGTIVAWAAFDALAGGNMLYFGTVTPNKTVPQGDTLQIGVGVLKFKSLNSA